MASGLTFEPDPNDPAHMAVKRAMDAVKKAVEEMYDPDEDAPNFTIVACVPPEGRIGIATTEPAPELALEALMLGWGALHKTLREAAEAN